VSFSAHTSSHSLSAVNATVCRLRHISDRFFFYKKWRTFASTLWSFSLKISQQFYKKYGWRRIKRRWRWITIGCSNAVMAASWCHLANSRQRDIQTAVHDRHPRYEIIDRNRQHLMHSMRRNTDASSRKVTLLRQLVCNRPKWSRVSSNSAGASVFHLECWVGRCVGVMAACRTDNGNCSYDRHSSNRVHQTLHDRHVCMCVAAAAAAVAEWCLNRVTDGRLQYHHHLTATAT